MKLLVPALAAISTVLALAFLANGWAFGLSGRDQASSASSSTHTSVAQSDVKTALTWFAPPEIINTNQTVPVLVGENIRNDGPAADQVVLVKTLKVPADCEGQVDSSLTVQGPDTAVVFGTLPVFPVGQDVPHSEIITIGCFAGGLYRFELREEVQPLFNEDESPADNVVIAPFDVCSPGAPNEDVDGDGLTAAMEAAFGTNPCKADTDGDGMSDGYETAHACLNPALADTDLDPDGDTLTNLVEFGLGTNPCKTDTDGDGCADGEELGSNPILGGRRDPLDGWDFYDVPVPALLPGATSGIRSGAVNVFDVLAVINYVGTKDGGGPNTKGADYNSNLNGNGVDDGIEYDRQQSLYPGQPWRSGAPTGAVNVFDVMAAIAQVGQSCTAPP